MSKIDIKTSKKDITILFDYPFDWAFVNACRECAVSWDDVKKLRYVKIKNIYLPLDSKKLIKQYQKVFNFFEKNQVDQVEKYLQELINERYEINKSIKPIVDFSHYPDLFSHQKIGVEFLMAKKSAILADDMGLGKTRQSLIYALEADYQKILIVTPLSARFVWKDELLDLHIKQSDIDIPEKKLRRNFRFIIINYDKLKKFFDDLSNITFDLIIFDEAHYCKNKASQRTKAALKLAKKSKNAICVTGTPLLNKPVELFPLLKMINHPLGSNFSEYTKTFCDKKLKTFGTRSYWDFNGASNLDELSEKLKSVMIRREKKDCLDLPDKIYSVYHVDMGVEAKYEYEHALDDYIKFCKSNRVSNLTNILINQHIVKLNLLRQICSKHKLPYTEQHIIDALESGEKILIFGYYNETLKALYEKYKDKALIITGDVRKPEEREHIVKQFQTNPKYKIFIGNIRAAGVALTLTAGNHVVFNDLSWTPGDHLQAEDRSNRIGATKETKIYYPIFTDTIEEDIYELLKEKQIIINKILDGTITQYKDETMAKAIIQKFYNKING